MPKSSLDEQRLKQMMKEALVETLHEQRELLQEVIAEVVEDFALAEAIREGKKTKLIPRERVFKLLKGGS
jgi:hypothetical protein